MKNLLVLLLTISFLTCFLTSCEKESNVVPNAYEFEGEWSWVETTSGWSLPLNPDSLGHSLSLLIDHTKYSILIDDVLSEQWSYEFKMDTNHFGNPIEYIILETGKRYDVWVDAVNLVLSDHVIDGSSWHYVRK